MRLSSALLVAALPALTPIMACDAGATHASARATSATTSASPSPDSTPKHPAVSTTKATAVQSASPELTALIRGDKPVRALYVNRFAAQGSKSLRHLVGIADSTEINALVIDIKDEFGLNFHSTDPMLQKNEGKQTKIANLKAVVDTLRAHNILPIARIVVFKDSNAARANPDHVIRQANGAPWHDKQGLTWVNPYAKAIWEYNFRVADEAIKMGFGEIQFDYIRFPEPYKSLPGQVFPESNGRSKPDILAEFLSTARARFAKQGIRTTADIFGLVTTVHGALEVGQAWEKVSPSVDVVLPMVYPSHYPHGSFGIAAPNAEPHKVILIALTSARQRDQKLGITKPDHIRPWLQAFTLGPPKYSATEVQGQKQAAYDAGYDGWVLWNPGSKYDIFLPALEKTWVSRKKATPIPMPSGAKVD